MTEAGPRPRRRWGRWLAVLAVALVAVILGIGLMNREAPAPPVPLIPAAEREAAPDIRLPVLQAAHGVGPEGAEVSLADLRGRIVVVNVWAWWCAECREEVPELADLSGRYDPDEVLVLGLNSEDRPADARRFLADFPFPYPSLRDAGPASAKALGMWAYPATFVLDRDGRIAASQVGAIEEAGQLQDPIDALLRET